MADNLHLSENCRIFIDATEVHGVQSTSFGFSQPNINKQILGGQGFELWPNGPQVASLSVNSLLISKDLFYRYVSELPYLLNFYAILNRQNSNNNINLSTGYLTSYGVSCSVGEIPSINASFEFLGDFSKNVQNADTNLIAANSVFDSGIYQAAASSINVSVDGQRLQTVSFSADLRINRQDAYKIGSRNATSNVIWPIDVTCQFSIPSNLYSTYGLKAFPGRQDKQTINISIKSLKDDTSVASYQFEEMVRVEESFNTSLSSAPTVDVVYKGVIKEKPELPEDMFFYSNGEHSQSSDSPLSQIKNLNLDGRFFTASEMSKVGSSFSFGESSSCTMPQLENRLGRSVTFAAMIQSSDFNRYETDALGTCFLGLTSAIYGPLGPRFYIHDGNIYLRPVFGASYAGDYLFPINLDDTTSKFVCCVFDAGANNSRAYAGNATPYETTYFDPQGDDSNTIYIGRNYIGEQKLKGAIEKFIIYNRALSNAEVGGLYKNFTA